MAAHLQKGKCGAVGGSGREKLKPGKDLKALMRGSPHPFVSRFPSHFSPFLHQMSSSFGPSVSPALKATGGSSVLPTMSLESHGAAAGKSAKKRCCATDCKMKLGLLGFDCRCGQKFCATHRYPDTHQCTFDHRGAAKAVLNASLQSCVADKLGGDRV